MVEHKICKGCNWNNYPLCNVSFIEENIKMRIDNLKPAFECGIKKSGVIDILYIKELSLKEEISDLKARILKLELKEVR